MGSIIDVTVACSYDDSQEYCTYDNPKYFQNELIGYSLMLIQSKFSEINGLNGFRHIENLIERVISHETIHVVIKKLEEREVSDKLDDVEISFPLGNGKTHLIKMNFLGYANDNTGLITVN
ncbi:MAG: hypothetical protein M3Z01_06205 [Thermoproteota archaeon]|nr:hypothetical protein [Thermoproteota archaeon]